MKGGEKKAPEGERPPGLGSQQAIRAGRLAMAEN
jgi:hypothetical protein